MTIRGLLSVITYSLFRLVRKKFAVPALIPTLLIGMLLSAGYVQANVLNPPPSPSPIIDMTPLESMALDTSPTSDATPGDIVVSVDVCETRDFVADGPMNELGGLGLGTPGQIAILRTACLYPDGTESWHQDYSYVWTVFSIEKTEVFPVETPQDWPWSAERIAEERATVEWDANFDGVPVLYPPYLTEEFISTGKIMTYPNGTITAGWVLQP
jgi:hypothetical protein